jgi:hypothetical protein
VAGDQAGSERRAAASAPAGQTPGGGEGQHFDERTDAALARRRRIADVFGDVLPDVTGDDRPDQAGRSPEDHWYLENRPPHH